MSLYDCPHSLLLWQICEFQCRLCWDKQGRGRKSESPAVVGVPQEANYQRLFPRGVTRRRPSCGGLCQGYDPIGRCVLVNLCMKVSYDVS